MGKVIGIINQKGGVGKSTLATHLAMTLYHNLNYNKESNFCCIYDADNPQYSIVSYRNEEHNLLKLANEQNTTHYTNKLNKIYTNNFTPITIYSGNITDVVEKIDLLRDNFEYSIVDVVGTVNTSGYDESFIKIFDYILIPMSNEFDVVRSTISFVSTIIAPIAATSNMNYGIVLNNVDVRESATYLELKSALSQNGFNILDSIINDRKKYVRMYMRDGSKGNLSTLFSNFDLPFIKLAEEVKNKIK